MLRYLALSFFLILAAALPAQDELPKADPSEPMDIEPPLLILENPNRNIVKTTPGTPDTKAADPDQLAAALEKARKSAASGERLYKAGIIAKVDAENRALKVIRLEAELAEARLEVAKENLALQETRLEAREIEEAELAAAKQLVASANSEAEAALAKKKQAELDAANLNLRRQQKLLAMGSGRKSEVSRAREKVSALQEKE